MKTSYRISIIIFLTCCFAHVGAQEFILPLTGNSELSKMAPIATAKKSAQATLLELPFMDDFSRDTKYPDQNKWGDNCAFVNFSYAVNPPSIGVATLDAIDHQGSVYADATISPKTFVADTLSSLPINLKYPAADSIYLSFFYQPQGLGLAPSNYDSLCVDFYRCSDSSWINQWQIPGDTLAPFKQVLIPITDTAFLKEGFKFRFRNRASMPTNEDYEDKRGNLDHWNIDYVILNTGRNYQDTVIRDVAFTEPLSSMLNAYEAIPWSHFYNAYNTSHLQYFDLTYYNNDSISRNVTRKLQVYDELWNETYDPGTSTAADIAPKNTTTYKFSSIYPFKFEQGDQGRFKIKAWLRTDEFDNHINDTIYRTQIFRDYFAYDDGSAERAYGLRGQGSGNGAIAVKFTSFKSDILAGVDIHFGQLMDSLNLSYYYNFKVWADNNGEPGDAIYEGSVDYTALYTDELNKFTRITFKEPVYLSQNQTFYVGLVQYNSYLLNIGLDLNNPSNGNIFYNLGNEWQQSGAPGSLMIRPFIKMGFFNEIEEINPNDKLKIWPNPASDYINIDLNEDLLNENISLTIYDLSGKILIKRNNIRKEVDLGHLKNGLYFIRLNTSDRIICTEKLVIKN